MAQLNGYNFVADGSPLGATWTVTHNLGTLNVAVDAMILNGIDVEKVMPLSIVAKDLNTVKITFSSPQTGYARIVAGVE